MKSKLPILIASLLLVAALIAALGGARLAWQPMDLRHPSDRQVLRALAESWQQEMSRLEEVLRTDLQDLLEAADPKREFTLREAQQRLQVVAEVTHLPESPTRPQRVRAGTVFKPTPPEVNWKQAAPVGPGSMDATTLLGYDFSHPSGERPSLLRPSQGWIRAPDQTWAWFWVRMLERDIRASARVATVHVPTVISVLETHHRKWLKESFAPVAALQGLNFVEGPTHAVLAGLGERPTDRPADFLAPVSSPWGKWQVLSWDRLETKPGWNQAVLTATALISGLLVLTAIFVFMHLRRALRQAEERVTFVNRVSHDLGTPLTNMMLNLDLAQDVLEDAPEQTAARLDIVREEGRRLGRLVENVLAFSRRHQADHPLRPVRCQPADVIAGVLQQFEPALKRRGVQTAVQTAVPATVLDPDALAQILANLISNVEKYAAAGGKLGITASATPEALEITVRDSGPGVPVHEREHIFAPFARLSSRVNEGASGTGLGLAIARDLARQMHGDLTCVDSPHGGATFRLRLPLPAATPQLAPSLA